MNFDFKEPEGPVDLLWVLMDVSADERVAELMEVVLERHPHLRVAAFGGECIASHATLMGMTVHKTANKIQGVIAKIPYFLKLKRSIADWIERHQPTVVCFSDAGAFNLRLAQDLHRRGISKKAGGNVELLYYICPQVWASRPHRRFVLNQTINAAATIVPMDMPFYENLDIEMTLVKNPLCDLRPCFFHDPEGPLLIAPGSRPTEIEKNLSFANWVVEDLVRGGLDISCVLVYPNEDILERLKRLLERHPKLEAKTCLQHRSASFGCRAGLLRFGTITLEATLSGVPHVGFHAFSLIDLIAAKLFWNVKYFSLENIVSNKGHYEEFVCLLRSDARCVAEGLLRCINDSEGHMKTMAHAQTLKSLLGDGLPEGADWLESRLSTCVKAN